MDKELKAKWIEALRSGKYEQGERALCNKDQFCCLGVLADISGLGKWEIGTDGFRRFVSAGEVRSVMTLATEFLNEIGLPRDEAKYCWKSNDGVDGLPKRSFVELANYIEEHL